MKGNGIGAIVFLRIYQFLHHGIVHIEGGGGGGGGGVGEGAGVKAGRSQQIHRWGKVWFSPSHFPPSPSAFFPFHLPLVHPLLSPSWFTSPTTLTLHSPLYHPPPLPTTSSPFSAPPLQIFCRSPRPPPPLPWDEGGGRGWGGSILSIF